MHDRLFIYSSEAELDVKWWSSHSINCSETGNLNFYCRWGNFRSNYCSFQGHSVASLLVKFDIRSEICFHCLSLRYRLQSSACIKSRKPDSTQTRADKQLGGMGKKSESFVKCITLGNMMKYEKFMKVCGKVFGFIFPKFSCCLDSIRFRFKVNKMKRD